MSFPRKLLAPGEEIVSETNPHWSLLVPRIALAVVIDAAGIALVLAWHSAPLVVGWIILAIGVLALLAVVAKLVSWRSTDLVITTRRVIYRTGVVHRFGREIPIDRIQDVTYRQTLLERILGAGSLTVESAGESGQEPFPDIRRPASVQSLINQLISGPSAWSGPVRQPAPAPAPTPAPAAPPPEPPRAVPTRFVPSAQAPAPAPPPASIPGGSHSEQLRHLDELHRLGVLTDAEYEQHRRQILDLP
jgi:membrane protein YdbS with pleckstrin-like domain